jgi:streptogramin lyase
MFIVIEVLTPAFHRRETAGATALDRTPTNFPARCLASGANALFGLFYPHAAHC